MTSPVPLRAAVSHPAAVPVALLAVVAAVATSVVVRGAAVTDVHVTAAWLALGAAAGYAVSGSP
ncbi:MAG TPA: hypothetical protein VES93_04340 [Ornithinibacter sp.]|nr:hypothetical protein [Ornithinibacter sp.]